MSLSAIKSESSLFHTEYIKGLKIEMPEDHFNKFRMYYINILIDELEEYFNSPSMIQQVLNAMQVGFAIWTDIAKLPNCKNELFMFFFAASCLIVLKLRCPECIGRFKNWACGHGIDLNFVYWSERLIMEKTDYCLLTDSSNRIQMLLNEEAEAEAEAESKAEDEEVNDLINTWVLYAFSEYSIYRKYDLMTITIAGSLLGMSSCKEEKGSRREALTTYIKNNEDICGALALCWECAEDIKSRYLSSNEGNCLEDNDQEVFELPNKKSPLTRANSIDSLYEAFSLYEHRSTPLMFHNEIAESNPCFLRRKRSSSIALASYDSIA